MFAHHNNWKVERCLSCGLVQVHPLPAHAEIASLYHNDLEHFDPYEAQLDVHRRYFRKKIRELKLHGSVLDVGCALGAFLEEAEKKGLDAFGIDISADAVAYCRQKGLRAYKGSLKGFNPVSERIDAITAFEVIEHEREPLAMLKRAYKLLRNGGTITITTPNHDSFWRKIMGKWWFGYQHPEHLFFFDPKSLRRILENAGFTDITVTRDTPRPFPLSFALTRIADYFPWMEFLAVPLGKWFVRYAIMVPVNPWDDIIATAHKKI